MTRDGRNFTVDVAADGEGLVSQAGAGLLAAVADRAGLTKALSDGLWGLRERRGGHDPGRVIRDLAVMLANGGDCLSDLAGLGEQQALFGDVASAATAFRVVDRIATAPDGLERLRAAHAAARSRVWELAGAPGRVTVDVDATLVGSHSEKEGAAGDYKGGFGFHPMLAYCDQTGEALASDLRPGNAGANNAADQIAAVEQSVGQIPAEHAADIEIVVRADTAGASHELAEWCRDGRIRFTVGMPVGEPVRAAILAVPERTWRPAVDQDASPRPNGQVCEITDQIDLSGWPAGSRVIVRRERPHPGAQLAFTDHEGHRFQAILTDRPGDIAELERDHRARARVEDHIRADKDTGLTNLPFRAFAHNQVWLALIALAHDLIAWTKTLTLEGDLARAEPKRLRHRLLHVAARLAFHARTATLRLQASWPWATDLAAAFTRLRALPPPAH
ncbi:MAG: IS1380 family transposase [Thermoleophilaceae bacterium]